MNFEPCRTHGSGWGKCSAVDLPALGFGVGATLSLPPFFSLRQRLPTAIQMAMINQIKFPSVEDFPGVITSNKTK